MRRVAVVAALLALSVPLVARAQGAERLDVSGVRQMRAYPVPGLGMSMMVSATDDGYVELFEPGPSFESLEPFFEREVGRFREFLQPGHVLEWAAGLDQLAAWLQSGSPHQRENLFIGTRRGSRIDATASPAGEVRRVQVSTYRCRNPGHGVSVTAVQLVEMAAAFRRAAFDARSVQPQAAPADPVWFEHAVACPATPMPGNLAPAFPRVPTSLRVPHDVLLQFVVNTSGNVESNTVRFPGGTHPAFATAVREVLPSWRYLPATRDGRQVRQLIHATIPFLPPITTTRAPCRTLGGGDSPPCEPVFSIHTGWESLSFRPRGDGTIRIAAESEAEWQVVPLERSFHRDAVPVAAFRRYVDRVARILADVDTTNWQARMQQTWVRDTLHGTPTRGFTSHFMMPAWLIGSMECSSTNSRFFGITPPHFAAFLRAAQNALDASVHQPRWVVPAGTAHNESDVACAVKPARENEVPARPLAAGTSIEVLASLIVDTLGRVEPGTVDIMPGTDSATARVAIRAIRGWRFQPAVARGRLVRSRTHMAITLRPANADAAILASQPWPVSPEDTLQRTVFYRSGPATPRVTDTFSSAIWREAEVAIQPVVERARQGWPSVRRRFQRGSPFGHEYLVVARIADVLGVQEHVLVRVQQVQGDSIHGAIRSDVRAVTGWRRGDRWSLAEADLIDWIIIAPDGSEEGNEVGRFLQTWQLLRPKR